MAAGPQGNLGRPRFNPSNCLIAMFRACSRDPTEAIQARLRSMLNTFLQHHRDNAGSENTSELAAVDKCCCQAGILYYRILEKHTSQERKRLAISDLSAILWNDLFHRCLVACCLEMIISSNRLPCDFPMVLQILKLAPYHFWRVIEPVVRAEGDLSRAVVRHLAQVEAKVLESLAWTSDSPLWEEIRANEGHLLTCQQVTPPTQLEDPNRADPQPDGDLPGALSRPWRSNPLHLFARKFYSLMGKRLRELCSSLDIPDELRLKIWTCFEYSLVNCTDFMVERHLDQLLMCAIYIMAKITNREIPFKLIMKCYNSQPLASRSVCKNVLISGRDTENSLTGNNNNGDHSNGILTPNTPSTHYPGPLQKEQDERGNLIDFYNQVYTTKMQHFAMQFAPTAGGDTPPVSPYPRQCKASPLKRRLAGRYSIFLSSLNTEASSPSASGLCYYFSSSPSERLREINNMIRTGRSPSRRGFVVSLDGEEEEAEGEDGPSAKRLHLDEQSALQRRLRNVVNDRATRRNPDQPSSFTKPSLH